MAKKRRKTVKVEIPVPDISSPKIDKKDLKKAAKSVDDFQRLMQKNTKNLAYVAVIVVAIVAIYAFSSSVPPVSEVADDEPKFRVVTEEVVETLSFSDLLENYQSYDRTSITLKGMLSYKIEEGRGQGTLGVYVYRLADDFGNEVDLARLTPQQRTLFVKGEVTEDVFEVTGTVEVGYMDFEIAVESITPSERDITILENRVPL